MQTPLEGLERNGDIVVKTRDSFSFLSTQTFITSRVGQQDKYH